MEQSGLLVERQGLTLPPIMTPSLDSCAAMHNNQQLTPPPMGPIALTPLKMSPAITLPRAAACPPIVTPLHEADKEPASTPPAKTEDSGAKNGDDMVTLFPRRKAGQSKPGGGRGPVVLTLELLEQFYGMPLHVAAKRLGICQTAIKKVCRRLGIKKWPYKEMRAPQITGDVEDAGGKSEEGSCEEEKKSAMKREQARVERRQEERKPRNDTAISSAVAALLSLHTEPGAA